MYKFGNVMMTCDNIRKANKAVAPPSLVQGDPNMVQNQPIYPDFSDANEMIPAALDACERILTR